MGRWPNLMVTAHTVGPLAPDDLWRAWTLEPALLVSLFVVAALYGIGLYRLWQRAGQGHGVHLWQAAAFACSLLVTAVALVSPLDALSGALFSAHMAQHMLLIEVVAPLLALSALPVVLLWALPRAWAHAIGHWWGQSRVVHPIWRGLSRPLPAWIISTVVLWIWHLPLLYQAALANETIHAFEHLMFVITAVLFWQVIVRPSGSRNQYGLGVLFLFTATLAGSVLGALLTFANYPWYAAYALTAPQWGMTALEDQQVAGLIMWLPGGALYSVIACVLFVVWLNGMESTRTMNGAMKGAMKEHEHA